MLRIEDIECVRINSSEDVRRAAEAFRKAVRDIDDYRIAACHNIAQKALMIDDDGNILATSVFGWTDAASDRWWRSPGIALDNPITLACRYTSQAFWCNAEGIRTYQPNRFLASIDLSQFEERSLTRAAIVTPVHQPFGQVGVVAFTHRDDRLIDLQDQFEKVGTHLSILARTFIESYVQIMCPAQHLPTGLRLSKREVECLRWAAIGKTDEEISAIIGRSRATVRFHIHNASLKLDAVNRSQSVFRATQLGYLGIAS